MSQNEKMWGINSMGEEVCLRCGKAPELWSAEFEKTGICAESWQEADGIVDDEDEGEAQ